MTSTPQDVSNDLRELARRIAPQVQAVTMAYTAALQNQIKTNASGRPGPNVITGNYRRSINRRTTRMTYGARGEVGTNAPQGRRLEHGFHGVDSLGRRYSQPAYPHFGPAFDFIAPQYEAAIARIANPTVSGDLPVTRTTGIGDGA